MSDPIYLLIHIHIAYMSGALLAAFEATTASEQPQRPNPTSDMKSVSPITYLSMCILLTWFGPFLQPLRPLQPPNSLGGQIWPQIWNQWAQLPTYSCAYCWYGMGPLWQPLKPLQPPYSLGGQIGPQIWNQWPKLPTYPCAYCWHGMGPSWQHLRPLQPPNSLGGQIWPHI